MSRRQQRAGGGLADRLPLARGAALGAAAYVVGYILTYVFVEMEDSMDVETITQASGDIPGMDIGTTDVVGWVFYSTQFVEFEYSVEGGGVSQSNSGNILSETADLGIPEAIWYLIPVVALLGAGYIVAQSINHQGDAGEAAKAGATVIAGYLPLAAIGAFLFNKSAEISQFDQTASISMGVNMATAIILAGVAYPLVLGAVGGALTTAGSSTGGGYQRRSPRQQQPPQQQPPQGGNPPQQGHAGQQQGHTGQQQGHTGQQGHAGQQQRGPGGHQQQDQNQGNRR
ncbi:hypothetical protein [Halapricum salinum]|uniref:DUF7978 domain-containing protein n=1 Tax=Halapricum salinum TaxID=1457250 RepID=A0A4D6HBT6_9EURY|nr:hypothetical protein [Halapricum salinum]QCC50981.1 hypothetical protein DV733_06860 [Halapricum salinum]